MPAEFSFLVKAENDGQLPVFPGELVRGMFLDVIASKDPKLATYLHDYPKIKPYAIKPLAPTNKRKRVKNNSWVIRKGDLFKLSFSILIDNLIEKVEQILIDLDNFTLANVKFSVVEPPNIKKQLYQSFKAREIKAFLLDFRTPVAFKAIEEKYINPFPEPSRILRSMIRIYSAFSGEEEPVKPPDSIEVMGYRIKTREIFSMGLKFIGSEGWVLYRVIGESKDLSKLLQLAPFSNIGIKRTLGLGVLRVRMFEEYDKKILRGFVRREKFQRKRPQNPINVLKVRENRTDFIKITIEKKEEAIGFRECKKIMETLKIDLPAKLKDGKLILLTRNKRDINKIIDNIGALVGYEITITNVEVIKPRIKGKKIRVYFITPTKLKSGFPSVEAVFKSIYEKMNITKDIKNSIYVKMADLLAKEEGFTGVVEYIFSKDLEKLEEAIVELLINGIGLNVTRCGGTIEIEEL